MIRDRNSFVALGLAVSLFLVGKAAAQTLYVHAGAAGANDGSSWTHAYNSLQDALAHAAGSGGAVNEIWVAAGTYMPDEGYTPVGGAHVPGSGDRTATFQLLNGVALFGGFAGGETMRSQRNIAANETILSGDLFGNDNSQNCSTDSDCSIVPFGRLCVNGSCIIRGNNAENSYRVVTGSNTDETAILDGFIITAGNANGSEYHYDRGAGMYNGEHSSPTVVNCTFRGNTATLCGGMFNGDDSTPHISSSSFFGNATTSLIGGGMCNWKSNPTIDDCTFASNFALTGGGGMHNFVSSATINNSTFHGNVAYEAGGAVVNASNSSVSLSGCVIEYNSAVHSGGGISNLESSPTITNCTFRGNETNKFGGGLFNYQSSNPKITDCVFIGNSALGSSGSGRGGGLANRTMSNPIITDCVFLGNSANSGGGLSNHGGSNPTVTRCTFSDNTADRHGGGMYNNSSSPKVTDSTFSANSAERWGGGMASFNQSSPMVTNSIFSGNWADAEGGAMYDVSSTSVVTNCTFSGNSAESGGGISIVDGSPTLTNNILWSNDDASGTGTSAQIHTVSGTPVVNHSIVQGGWSGAGGVGVLDVDPMFVDPLGPDGLPGTEDDNLRLLAGSPAIDAGDNAAVPSEVFADLDGHERIAYGTVDMGAYEYCPIQRLYGDVNDSGTVNFADISLVLDVFRGVPAAITFEDADIYPCGGDGNVNFSDVSAGINAFRGSPPCPNTCH